MEYLENQNISLEKARFIYLRKYDFAGVQMLNTFHHYGILNHETIRFSNSNVMNLFGKQLLLSKFILLKVFAKARQKITDSFSNNKLFGILKSADKIVLGDPNFKLYSKIPILVSGKEIVLLDDGLSSMEIAFNYAQNNNKVTSFSFLRSEAKIPNVDTVLSNNFSKLRSSFPALNPETVLFIGQPLYEAKLFSIKELKDLFRHVGERYSSKKILYVPHRWESMLSKMECPANFEIVTDQDLPLELYIAKLKELPGEVVSFYSSALITLKKILPETVRFTAIDIQADIQLEAIGKAYEKIGSNHIDVVALAEPVKTAAE